MPAYATALALCGGVHATEKAQYDASIAWLSAGHLAVRYDRWPERYELHGNVWPSRAMSRFMHWEGSFAAVGQFVDTYPRGHAYLLFENDDGEREVLLAVAGETHILRDRDELGELPPTEVVPQPEGSDLMSVVLLASHCVDQTVMHDGEDLYRVKLLARDERTLAQEAPYYSGPAIRCRYRITGDSRSRKASVWIADDNALRWPVRIQLQIPMFPDGLLRLRMASDPGPTPAPG